MIEIPAGAGAPSPACSFPSRRRATRSSPRGESSASAPVSRGAAQAADNGRSFYVGVCGGGSAIPDELIPAMGTYYVRLHRDPRLARAARTARVNLLSHVYILPYATPAVAAKAFSTLDHLSGWPCHLRCGAGGPRDA